MNTYGGVRYGGGLYYGGTIVDEPRVNDIVFLEANDRNQVVTLVDDGSSGPPQWSYWNPAAGAWAEALASPDPGDFPAFFALDDQGDPVPAVFHTRVYEAEANTELDITAVIVDFALRPSIMADHDGGLGDLTPRITVIVEGWGVPDVETASPGDALTTSVVRSDPQSWVAPSASDISVEPWPHDRAVRLPTRLEQSVRAYRITVLELVGAEIVAFTPIGTRRDLRKG